MGAACLSVVVPFHNVERYLGPCLDSLVAQARPIDEILLVDDRSTDGSRSIVERYAARHSVIRVLDTPRRGAAAARNVGLEAATGDWLAFVDADDEAQPEMYARLLSLAEAEKLQIALCNARCHYEDGRKQDHPLFGPDALRGPVSGAHWFVDRIEKRDFVHVVWCHLYRRNFIERHRLRFIEGLMHEDVTWTTRAMMFAERVAYDPALLYTYRHYDRLATAEERNQRLLRVIDSAKTDARLLEEYANDASDARLARAIRWQLVDGGLSVFHKIEQLSAAEDRQAQWRSAREEGYFALLWRNAVGFRQKRKVASRFVRSLAA